MPTLAHTKTFGYTEFNQNQSPESTRFTSPINQSDAYHFGNDSGVSRDTFVWNTEDQSSLIIPPSISTTSTTTAIPAGLSGILQADTPSLLTQYFEGTLAGSSDIAAPLAVIPAEPHAVTQGDIDTLINGNSILPE